MIALYVYAPTKFKIDGPIESMPRNGKPSELTKAGEVALAPGVYRFSNAVTVAPLTGNYQLDPAPEDKHGWPDPPTVERLTKELNVTQQQIVDFLGGSAVQTELAPKP